MVARQPEFGGDEKAAGLGADGGWAASALRFTADQPGSDSGTLGRYDCGHRCDTGRSLLECRGAESSLTKRVVTPASVSPTPLNVNAVWRALRAPDSHSLGPA